MIHLGYIYYWLYGPYGEYNFCHVFQHIFYLHEIQRTYQLFIEIVEKNLIGNFLHNSFSLSWFIVKIITYEVLNWNCSKGDVHFVLILGNNFCPTLSGFPLPINNILQSKKGQLLWKQSGSSVLISSIFGSLDRLNFHDLKKNYCFKFQGQYMAIILLFESLKRAFFECCGY